MSNTVVDLVVSVLLCGKQNLKCLLKMSDKSMKQSNSQIKNLQRMLIFQFSMENVYVLIAWEYPLCSGRIGAWFLTVHFLE